MKIELSRLTERDTTSQIKPIWVLKNDILSRIDERTIFQYYFPYKIDLRRNKYLNPFRADKSAGSCHFNYSSSGRFYFFDKSTGERFDVFTYISLSYGLSFREVLIKIDRDFNLNTSNVKSNEDKPLQSNVKAENKLPDVVYSFVSRPWSDKDLEYWSSYSISISDLEYYGVSAVQRVHASYNSYTWNLIYDYTKDTDICYVYRNTSKIDVTLPGSIHLKFYRPHAPNKSLKFKSSLYSNFHTFGYDKLAESGDILLIVSSLKDGLCLKYLGYTNFLVLSSETSVVIPEMEELKGRFKHIVYVLDGDNTGIASMQKAAKIYPGVKYVIVPDSFGGKDISDIVQFQNQSCKEEQNNLDEYLRTMLKFI